MKFAHIFIDLEGGLSKFSISFIVLTGRIDKLIM